MSPPVRPSINENGVGGPQEVALAELYPRIEAKVNRAVQSVERLVVLGRWMIAALLVAVGVGTALLVRAVESGSESVRGAIHYDADRREAEGHGVPSPDAEGGK